MLSFPLTRFGSFFEMTLQSGYGLSKLKAVYTSKLREDLTKSITTLRNTIEEASISESMNIQPDLT